MKTKGFRHKDKLHKLMISVSKYVQSQTEEQHTDTQERRADRVKKRSRKEKRREKRKARKVKLRKFDHLPDASEKHSQRETSENSFTASASETVQTRPAEHKAQSLRHAEKKPKRRARRPDHLPDVSAVETKRAEVTAQSLGHGEKRPKRKVSFVESQISKKTKLDEARRRKALLEANEAEDREIKRLEKRLKLNKRKNKHTLPQSFVDDGLDYILGILEAGVSEALLEEGEEEESDTERLRKVSDSEEEEEEEEGGSEAEEGNEVEINNEEERDDDIEEEQKDEEEIEEDDITEDEKMKSEEEEKSGDNTASSERLTSSKYVPPYLRETTDSKRKAELETLKRKLKGLINRLSESNMGSISGQVEEMYMSCSRKDMNDSLTELLLAACVTPALMSDRLLMEHILLLSVLHHTVGLEVGAHFLETVVRRFAEMYLRCSDGGKECDNLLSIIAHLYNFQVVHSLLLFDLLKRLVTSFMSRDVELLLLLLRNVGFALRKDDPLALKELITEAQRKASSEGQRFSDQTRVRFMLETMLALKNNDMRKIPGYDPEPVERLRKLQRILVQQRASGTDVKLRVSLENLLEAERVGRWWIVGSSWSGVPMINDSGDKTTSQPSKGEQFSAKVLELARKQRMNTDVRRNIFCVIMTSEDYLDAFEKLLRLGLKGQQERDIIHVLLDCCLQEKSFNGFYAVLAEKFCTHDRHFQMTVQFCLWDKFKELESLSSNSFSNLVQMVTHLLHKSSLSLSILKAIEFGELDKHRVKFLRQVLSKLLLQTQLEDLVQIFGRISGIPKLGMLREGLKLFISHFLLRSTQTQVPAQQTTLLTEKAEIATKAMEVRDTKLKL